MTSEQSLGALKANAHYHRLVIIIMETQYHSRVTFQCIQSSQRDWCKLGRLIDVCGTIVIFCGGIRSLIDLLHVLARTCDSPLLALAKTWVFFQINHDRFSCAVSLAILRELFNFTR